MGAMFFIVQRESFRRPPLSGGLALMPGGLPSQGNVYPRPLINELCMRQMVSDVRQPAWVHRYVNSSTLHVVTVVCALDGVVEISAAESAVDFNRYAKVFAQRFQDLGAQTYEVIDFLIVDAILYFSLLGDLASKHLF